MLENYSPSLAADALPDLTGALHSADGNIFANLPDQGLFKGLNDLQVAGNDRIEWAASLQDGIKQAQAQGKPLVCLFEADNCGWCQKFDLELTKPAAAQIGQDAVFVRINSDHDDQGRALANNLGISAYPTVSILDIKGTDINERSRTTGFMSAEDFAAHIRPSTTIFA